MPIPPILATLAGLAFLLGAIAFAADDVSMFFNLPGLLIVVGGTLAALVASYPLRQIKDTLLQLAQFKPHAKPDMAAEIEKLNGFSRLWFRHQYSQIDVELEKLTDPFVQHGLQMIRDKQSLDDVLTFLNWRISQYRTKAAESINLLRSMATFAPAFGMVGSVIGLVNMLHGLDHSALPAITSDMVVALASTFYGLMLANLVFKPIATKLEQKRQEETTRLGILAEGIALIAQGRTPGMIQDTLLNLIQDTSSEPVKQAIIPTLNTKARA